MIILPSRCLPPVSAWGTKLQTRLPHGLCLPVNTGVAFARLKPLLAVSWAKEQLVRPGPAKKEFQERGHACFLHHCGCGEVCTRCHLRTLHDGGQHGQASAPAALGRGTQRRSPPLLLLNWILPMTVGGR